MRLLAWPARSNAARNPFQKLLYDAVEATGGVEVAEFAPMAPFFGPRADVLHLHWPDAFLAAGKGWRFWPRYLYLRALGFAAWLRGTRLVWTAHNLERDAQRHGDRMARLFWPWFLGRVDGVIYMTRASAEIAAETRPALAKKPSAVIPHGHYKAAIAQSRSSAEPGQTGPKDDLPVVMIFGSITAYKNAWRVLEAFLQLPKGTARLEINGKMSLREPDLKFARGLENLPEDRRDEVSFDNRFLPEDELIARLDDADLVVFAYGDVLNSGAAIFALSAGRPILASDADLFVELQDQIGADWVRLIKGDLDGEQLRAALIAAKPLGGDDAEPDLSPLDWEVIGAQTVAFYTSLLTGKAAV